MDKNHNYMNEFKEMWKDSDDKPYAFLILMVIVFGIVITSKAIFKW